MRIRFTETALAEIEEVLSYISERNPNAATEIADAIRRTVAWINARPQASPVVHSPDVRAKRVGRFQYRVYYELRGDDLIIRNVRSTRRQPPWEPS